LRAGHLHVAEVITEFFFEDGLALIVGIEVEVEGVDDAGALVVDDDAARDCAISLAVRVWADSFQPWWVLGVVVVSGEVHILFGAVVQSVEVFQRQRRSVGEVGVTVDFGVSVG